MEHHARRAEVREMICQCPRLNLALNHLASSSICKPGDEDSVATQCSLGRLMLDVDEIMFMPDEKRC